MAQIATVHLKENGSSNPECEIDDGRSSIVIHLPVHVRAFKGLAGKVTPHVTPHVTPQVGTKSAPSRHQVTDKVAWQARTMLGLSRDQVAPQVAPQAAPQVTPQVLQRVTNSEAAA